MTSKPCRAAALSVVLVLSWLDAASADTPTALVSSGVSDYYLVPPKAYWHTAAYCPPDPPKSPVGPDDAEEEDGFLELEGGGAAASDPEVITRIPTFGGTKRVIFEENPSRPADECNPYHFFSDIAADETHLYWVDATGLVRLSVEANPGDDPEILNATIVGADNLPRAELAMGDDAVYVLRYVTATKGDIFKVLKSTGARSTVWHLEQHCSKLSFDGTYIFYKPDPSSLFFRVDADNPSSAVGVATGDGIHGATALCSMGLAGRPPLNTHLVYVGHGPRLYRYSAISGDDVAVYQSTDAQAEIFAVTADSRDVFFLEARPYTCPDCIFPVYNQLLFRLPRTGGGGAELIYLHQSTFPIDVDAEHLTTDGDFLYWEEAGKLLRLPNDASELPMTNLRVTGIEVNQSIQDLSNSVPLIEDKRTFARVYVKSDGPGAVPHVTCHLFATWTGGGEGPIGPHYASGSFITVRENPNRDNIDESFIFELPLDWTRHSNLRLRAELNPNKVPLQQSYANNSLTIGPLTFRDSPRLEVQFIAWKYDWNGTTYSPDYQFDILAIYSWIRRAYPLSSIGGDAQDPTPGFRPRLQWIYDEDLGVRVDRTADECTGVLNDSDSDNDEENDFCAANYTNSRMAAMRAEAGDNVFYCGLTSDGHKFPRGRASGSVSSVPVGPPGSGNWDVDSTYGDWYAGHEIAHTLGRGHPAPAADDPDTNAVEGCGHSPDDPNFPYAGAAIGSSGTTLEGLDVNYDHQGPAVLPRSTWTDMMSYCNFQWVSDYTYEAMLTFLEGQGGGAQAAGAGAGGGQAGDWLSVFGIIYPTAGHGVLHHTRRLSSVGSIPPRRPGGYSIRLLDAQGATVGDYPFVPGANTTHPESQALTIGQIVPFVPGARLIKVVKLPGGETLAMRSISANPPVVSNVALQNPPNPVAGTVTLAWTASDADGDSLCFDILFTQDGVSFKTLLLNVKGTSRAIDTAQLPGGAGRFRVVATDGVQSGFGDSPTYTFAGKPPLPRILLPATGTTVHWGQMLYFLGEADDAQDGSVEAAGLRWSVGRRILGTGPAISVDDLPVGQHLVSLRAVNSHGLADSTSITVIVDDEISLPGPTLSVAPLAVGWHVPAGATHAVPKQIQITNSGAGTLQWSLAESAAWLEVSAVSGAAPAFVTLTADPSGFPAGTELKEEVVVTGPGGQRKTVTVALAIGLTYNVDPEPSAPVGGGFKRGDSNQSGGIDISDAVNTLGFLFSGSGGVTCPDAADANDDGAIDISDAVATLGFLFLGLAPPPAPGPISCGGDPTPDALGACAVGPAGC